MIINATSRHTVAEYLGDVIAGTQNVGHDEPERKGFGDAPYRFGHVDAIVPRAELPATLGRLLRLFDRGE